MGIWYFFLFAPYLSKFSCYVVISCVCQTGIFFMFALPSFSPSTLGFWLLFDYIADVALTELFLNRVFLGLRGIKELNVNTTLIL